MSSPAVVNGVVYIGSGGRQRVCAERQHRRQAVELCHRRRCASSPAVANGVVYVGSDDGNLYALNASTGAKLWSYATGDGCAFLARSGEWDGLCRLGADNVYALNASTGAMLWSYATGNG